MRDLKGKTAFVTGGASGFGLEFAKLFLAEGMNVFLADIEASPLETAIEALEPLGKVSGAVCDVAKRASLQIVADEAIAAFGAVHLVCNNAGIGGGSGGVEEFSERHWDWVTGVNMMGVVHGISVFLPHMRSHGQGGHFVNTASMAGLLGQPYGAPYSASKSAVIAISESLSYELRDTNIGVSVLCPGFAKTGIAPEANAIGQPNSRRRAAKPSRPPPKRAAMSSHAVATGIEPAEVAARTLRGIKDGDLYIFTHPGMRKMIEKRFERIGAAYDKAERHSERSGQNEIGVGRSETTSRTYAARREPYPPAFFAAAAEALKLSGREGLIDLGTGPDLLALGFAPYVGSVLGVDPEPAMVAAARQAAAEAIIRFPVIEVRAEDVAAELGPFDLATIGRALHWMDRERTLAVLDRILAPDARILVCGSTSVAGESNPWRAAYDAVLRSWRDPRDGAHRRVDEHWFDSTRFMRIGEVKVGHNQEITPQALFERALTRSTSSPAILGERVGAFRAELLEALGPFFPNFVGREVIEAKAWVFGPA